MKLINEYVLVERKLLEADNDIREMETKGSIIRSGDDDPPREFNITVYSDKNNRVSGFDLSDYEIQLYIDDRIKLQNSEKVIILSELYDNSELQKFNNKDYSDSSFKSQLEYLHDNTDKNRLNSYSRRTFDDMEKVAQGIKLISSNEREDFIDNIIEDIVDEELLETSL
jgi:hypothetical protein